MVEEEQTTNIYKDIPASWETPPQVMPRDEDKTIGIIESLSSNKSLINLIYEFRGKVYDKKLAKYISIEGIKPMMNEEGTTMVFNFVRSAVDDINTYSNFRTDIRLIYRLMRKLLRDIIYRLHYYYKDYGIKRKSEIVIIIDRIQGILLAAYFKALGAGDRRAATSNISETISRLQREMSEPGMTKEDEKKRGGMLSRWLNR